MNSKGFTLIEVLIALTILTGGIVFILRSFMISQSASRIFQDTYQACLLAEERMLEIEESYKKGISLEHSGDRAIQGKEFKWDYAITDTSVAVSKNLELIVSWFERQEEYKFKLFTYLPK